MKRIDKEPLMPHIKPNPDIRTCLIATPKFVTQVFIKKYFNKTENILTFDVLTPASKSDCF